MTYNKTEIMTRAHAIRKDSTGNGFISSRYGYIGYKSFYGVCRSEALRIAWVEAKIEAERVNSGEFWNDTVRALAKQLEYSERKVAIKADTAVSSDPRISAIEEKRFLLSMKDRWTPADRELDRKYESEIASIRSGAAA